MRFDLFGADGLERSQADVQSDFVCLHPRWASWARISGVKWRPAVGAATDLFRGVHGLIPVVIRGRIRTCNVGRKRDVTNLLDHGEEISAGAKRMRRSPNSPREITSA